MSHTLKELAENPNLLDGVWDNNANKCEKCGYVMHWSDEFCQECAYDELGDIVEQNPIPSAGIRRS